MNDVAADNSRPFAASPVGDSAVAVVTGGAAGIGEAIARRLSADGFTVVIADLDRNRAEAVATEISARGGQALGRQVDVSAAESVAALFAWLTDELDRCDVLVNNAGVASTAPLAEVELERWNSTIAINVTAALLTTQHAVPLMKSRRVLPLLRGRVVYHRSHDSGRRWLSCGRGA